MQIIIDNNPIDVVIERKKIKNMYMRVKSDLHLHITCNRFVTETMILNMINQNKDFILKMYYKENKKNNPSVYKCLGEEYKIVLNDEIKKVYIDNKYIYASSLKEIDKYFLKEAKEFMSVRFKRVYSLFENLPDASLRFRKMTSRWGVNNVREKIITLNTELYKYDVSLIDYVIIHELCHFKEANHSARFWNEVSKFYPNYKMARKLLKE